MDIDNTKMITWILPIIVIFLWGLFLSCIFYSKYVSANEDKTVELLCENLDSECEIYKCFVKESKNERIVKEYFQKYMVFCNNSNKFNEVII